jgi:amino acid transporter
MSEANVKKMRWYNLALMAFVTVWGFGNVVNNYANQGLTVIVSWVLIISLYFIPYVLMVGELGSAFRNGKAGVSTWIRETSTPMLAYLAGWTYWVVHVPYLAQKPQGVLIAISWFLFQDGSVIKNMNPMILQPIALIVFLVFLWIASKGITSLKRIGSIAGTSMFVMSLLYVLLMIAAPAITGTKVATINFSAETFIPKFDFTYFTTIAMLVFAVGGAEKLSPYVNNTENPDKEFPKGMIILAIMVAVSAILGSIAMGMMFDPNNIPEDLMMNGAYYSFQLLGEYYGVGNLLLIIYALANTAAQVSALLFSIDAPLKVLLAEADERYIPKALGKTNKHGAPINGYIMTAILVGALIMIPAFGIGNMNELFNWLLKLNAVVMPLRYLWVFVAYMGLKRMADKYDLKYKFVKNDKVGFAIGLWCFVFTAFACIMGMFPSDLKPFTSEWNFIVSLNILTPFILMGLGLILPMIARKVNKLDSSQEKVS